MTTLNPCERYSCYETTLRYGVGVRSDKFAAIHDRTAASVESFLRCLISEIQTFHNNKRISGCRVLEEFWAHLPKRFPVTVVGQYRSKFSDVA